MTDLSDYSSDPQSETEPEAPAATDKPEDDTPLPPAQFEHKGDEEQHKKLLKWIEATNIADDIDESILGEIGQRVCTEYEVDKGTRSDWMEKTQKAMDLAMQVSAPKTYPWPKASNIIFPLMTTAAIQFAARAYPSIITGKAVVKGVVVGPDEGTPVMTQQGPAVNPQTGQPIWAVPPGAKRVLASKIGEHMSWQLLDEQTEWEEETDKLLHILPIVGCAFRKTYFDSSKDRNASVLVSAMKVVINYGAKSIETAPRITEELSLYPLEIEENERAGVFLDIVYSAPDGSANDRDAAQEFLEQHRYWDLDEDGYAEPYVVTVHKQTQKVVRIVARYDHDGVVFSSKDHKILKIIPIHYFTKYDFLPNPDGGIYGVGFGQLLRPINEAVNTSMNMMVDAGHLAVTGGGFIGKGLSLNAGAVRFSPGEYKPVNATGTSVKESIVPLQFPGPSPVLFQLLGTLIEAGKDVAAVKDVLTGEQKGENIPATTTLALIEQGLKVFTAIYKRIHRSLKKELEKLYRLNSIYLPESGAGYRKDNVWQSISRHDYAKGSGVEPLSDPSMVSDQQRLGRAQFLLGFKGDLLFNQLAIRQRVLDAANIEKPQELLVTQPPPNPEMLESAAKLEITQERGRAESLRNYAQALLFIAQADAALGDAHLGWAEHQLAIIKTRMEALNGQPGTDTKPATPPLSDQDTGLGGVATAPHNTGASSVPSGLSGVPQQGGMGAPEGGGPAG